jgi:hypothetical protein
MLLFVPFEYTEKKQRYSPMLQNGLHYRDAIPELYQWLHTHMPAARVSRHSNRCLLEIDKNDTEGRALLKLTWGIG